MLRPLLGAAPNQVAFVTFDSQPEGASPFSTDISEWQDAIDHPDPGDDGAAILDSIAFALRLFKDAPPNARRAILLISQNHDKGSRIHVADLARALGEGSTALYALTFSAERATLQKDFTEPAHLNPPLHMPGGQSYVAYFNLSAPLSLALGAMQKNAAADLAGISGGEAGHFNSRNELESDLNTLNNHLRNTYILSFRPSAPTPGVHQLVVRLPAHPELQISARSTYWVPQPEMAPPAPANPHAAQSSSAAK